MFFNQALIFTGFLLYNPVTDCDELELDSCDVLACPHDQRLFRPASMLTPMGSLGEECESGNSFQPEFEGDLPF